MSRSKKSTELDSAVGRAKLNTSVIRSDNGFACGQDPTMRSTCHQSGYTSLEHLVCAQTPKQAWAPMIPSIHTHVQTGKHCNRPIPNHL